MLPQMYNLKFKFKKSVNNNFYHWFIIVLWESLHASARAIARREACCVTVTVDCHLQFLKNKNCNISNNKNIYTCCSALEKLTIQTQPRWTEFQWMFSFFLIRGDQFEFSWVEFSHCFCQFQNTASCWTAVCLFRLCLVLCLLCGLFLWHVLLAVVLRWSSWSELQLSSAQYSLLTQKHELLISSRRRRNIQIYADRLVHIFTVQQ